MRTTPMENEHQVQGIPLPLPAEPFKALQRANWDAATPFVSDAPPLLSPPPRMRPRPNKPSEIVECRPNDIERLSLPVLTMDDPPNGHSSTPLLPLNILPRSRPWSDFSRRSPSKRGVCGKRTRPTEKRYENSIFKSATLQYAGISGKTIYADPVVRAQKNTDDLLRSCGNKKGVDEDIYLPSPRFTLAARSALPHVLRLSD